MRRWLRLLPLAALALGLTWSGARASAEAEPTQAEPTRTAVPQLEAAPELPPTIATSQPSTPSEFAFTNLRRF